MYLITNWIGRFNIVIVSVFVCLLISCDLFSPESDESPLSCPDWLIGTWDVAMYGGLSNFTITSNDLASCNLPQRGSRLQSWKDGKITLEEEYKGDSMYTIKTSGTITSGALVYENFIFKKRSDGVNYSWYYAGSAENYNFDYGICHKK